MMGGIGGVVGQGLVIVGWGLVVLQQGLVVVGGVVGQ